LLIGGKTGRYWETVRLRSSSNNNVLGANSLFTTGIKINLNFIGRCEFTPSLDVINLVLFKEVLDTTGKTSDSTLLGLLHLLPVNGDRTSHNTKILELVLGFVEFLGGVKKSL
jgi:hypothetical protein